MEEVQTPNHGLYYHGQGNPNWQYAADMWAIEKRLPIRDSVANLDEYDPQEHAWMLADDGQIFISNASNTEWVDPDFRDFDELATDHDDLRSDHEDLDTSAAHTGNDETVTGAWSFNSNVEVGSNTIHTSNSGSSSGFSPREGLMYTHYNDYATIYAYSGDDNVGWRFRDPDGSGDYFRVENSDGSAHLPHGGLNVGGDLDVGGTTTVSGDVDIGGYAEVTDYVSFGTQGSTNWETLWFDDSTDTFYFVADGEPTSTSNSNSTVQAGTFDALSQINESGDRVATRTWVDSNFTGYTDDDARSAVDGSTIDGLSINNDLDVGGQIDVGGYTRTTFSGGETRENVAHYYGSSSGDGVFVVELSNLQNSMIDAEIVVQSYSGLVKYHVRGYTYTSTDGWHNPEVTMVSSGLQSTVRFAGDGDGTRYILLGDPSKDWGNHPHAAVTRVTVGYGSGISDWSISLEDSEPSFVDVEEPVPNKGMEFDSPTLTGGSTVEGGLDVDGSPVLTEADESGLEVSHADTATNADEFSGTSPSDGNNDDVLTAFVGSTTWTPQSDLDAGSVNGYEIQKDGTDGSGIINFKTS